MRKKIAIVGSLDDTRQPPFRNAVEGRKAAEQLGKVLAERGYRLVVYSARDPYIERHVVRGYIQAGGAGKKSVEVEYPAGDGADAAFPERLQHEELFELIEDRSPNWEMSFYRSLKRVDGVVLLGGSGSSRTAGLVTLANRIPLAAVSAYGGAAQEIRNSIVPGQDLPGEKEFQVMAQPGNVQGWVECLEAQFATRRKELRQQAGTVSALVALLLLVTWVLTLPAGYLLLPARKAAAPPTNDSAKTEVKKPPATEAAESVEWRQRLFIFLVFVAPMVAGASGATVRMLRAEGEPATMGTTVLGIAAAAMASLLYILAQLVSNADPYTFALLMFGVVVGFIAGFTFDAVLKKLETVQALNTDVLTQR